MIATFTVHTTKQKCKGIVNRKRVFENIPVEYTFKVHIEGTEIYLGYGYKTWTQECTEGFDSVCPGEKYTLVNSIKPKQGDVWKHGNRTFVLGEQSGFVIYTAPLFENGKQVATVHFEDYYKD